MYDLLHYEHENGSPFALSLRSRLLMITDIACALQHLATKQFLHLDLASFNVLVWRDASSGDVRCKLADFSFAINKNSISCSRSAAGGVPARRSSVPLPTSRVAWKAPELVSARPAKPSERTEVYSFGMIMYEILTRRVPYQGLQDISIAQMVQDDAAREEQLQLPEAVDALPANAPDAARQQLQDAVDLMRRCLQTQPAHRPDFSDIVQQLRSVQCAQPVRRHAAAAARSSALAQPLRLAARRLVEG